MADKVWLVRAGCYSDQWIMGAFTTEAKADAYAAAHNGPPSAALPRGRDDAWVDEYELDPEYIEANHSGFEVLVSRAGDVLAIEKREGLLRTRIFPTESGFFVQCFARDATHAAKIATEKRQEEAARAAAGGS